MPPFLPSDLLCRIGDILDDLQCYTSARGACAAWRCALAPVSPSLLVVYASSHRCPTTTLTAASLHTQRSIELKAFPSGTRCMGSRNGWLALSVGGDRQGMFSLFHPITGTQIPLPPVTHGSEWVSKIVFAPSPATDDFSAAAICNTGRLAYVTAGAKSWAVLDPVDLLCGDYLADVVYHENGKVYCLTQLGDVYVLRLPERRRREPIKVDDPVDPSSGPSYAGRGPGATFRFWRWRDQQQHDMLSRISSGPDLTAPATFEPLSEDDVPFEPATEFAPPYNKFYAFTTAKNLVFSQGNLYQIWRNVSCPVTLQLPGGGAHRRVEENGIFVLRYYPRRQPCWDAVTDLSGYSVFVGRNNAVSVPTEGVPGLMGNCVYWIGGLRDQAMVFDMATRTSTHCLPGGHGTHNIICWYFLSDIVNKCNNNDGCKRVYQTRARARAERERNSEE